MAVVESLICLMFFSFLFFYAIEVWKQQRIKEKWPSWLFQIDQNYKIFHSELSFRKRGGKGPSIFFPQWNHSNGNKNDTKIKWIIYNDHFVGIRLLEKKIKEKKMKNNQ